MPSTPRTPPSHRARRSGPDRRLVLGAVALVVIVAAVLAVLFSKSPAKSPGRTPHASTSTTTASLASGICPLTDTRAPGGVVPKRPALAVKIGNEPQGARPQSGLNEADIVYDTPAEGGIMRYEAVYQCTGASSIGPVRSLRWVDWHILAMFRNRPLLVHAGGIQPDITALDSVKYVTDVNLLSTYAADSTRITSRVPPDNLYTDTAQLWASFPNEKAPPAPVFHYSSSLPASAKPAKSIEINFSQGTDGVWTWNPASSLWLHSYAGSGPDIDALTNKQVSTNNVVVQVVKYSIGPYIESPGGTGDVESVLTGTGPGYILRNGKEIPVTWHRPNASAMTTFTDAHGAPVDLTPGRTFVEIVLDTTAALKGAVTITP